MTTQPDPAPSNGADPGPATDPDLDVPPELVLQYLARVDESAGTRHLNEAVAMASQHVLLEALKAAKKGL